MKTFSQDEMLSFFESVKDTEYHSVFYTALFTGMRRSELLALRWSDIDLDLGVISINRNLHHLADKSFVFQPPKTAKSRRQVPLAPSNAIVLKVHRERQRATRLLMDQPVQDDSLVFARYMEVHFYLTQSPKPGDDWLGRQAFQEFGCMMHGIHMPR